MRGSLIKANNPEESKEESNWPNSGKMPYRTMSFMDKKGEEIIEAIEEEEDFSFIPSTNNDLLDPSAPGNMILEE